MTPEQKAVILDYAQELQGNDEPWREFEFYDIYDTQQWRPCTQHISFNFHVPVRRKPRTITVTIPVPKDGFYGARWNEVVIPFYSEEDCDQALAVIREAMGDE